MIKEAEEAIALSEREKELQKNLAEKQECYTQKLKAKNNIEAKKKKTEKVIKEFESDLQQNEDLMKTIEEIKIRKEYQDEEDIKVKNRDPVWYSEAESEDYCTALSPPDIPSPTPTTPRSEDWHDEFACCVCLEIPKGHVFACHEGHILCGGCDGMLRQKNPYQCPQCRVDLSAQPLAQSVVTERMIRRMF